MLKLTSMLTQPRPQICLVTPEYPPLSWGGLARTVARVAGHLRKIGMEVHVAVFEPVATDPVLFDENRHTTCSEGITVHRIRVSREQCPAGQRTLWDCPHTLTLRMMHQSLEKLSRENHFRLLHSFFLYPIGYVTGLLARQLGLKHVITLVGNDIKKYAFSPEKAYLCARALSGADHVIGLSRDLLDLADALEPVADKSGVIFNSVSLPPESWQPHGRSDGFKIGFAGIFKYAKGLPYLLKAVETLKATGPVTLELVGDFRDEEKPRFEAMMESHALTPHVVATAPMDHAGISSWLRGLDAFVLPSISEGCPNILMEAMANGVPSVATAVGAVPDLMIHERSGLLVPWGDAKALALALDRLRRNPQLAAELGRMARARMGEFSVARETSAWLEVYARLLDFADEIPAGDCSQSTPKA